MYGYKAGKLLIKNYLIYYQVVFAYQESFGAEKRTSALKQLGTVRGSFKEHGNDLSIEWCGDRGVVFDRNDTIAMLTYKR